MILSNNFNSSVIEERRGQGAKGQTMGKLFLSGSLVRHFR